MFLDPQHGRIPEEMLATHAASFRRLAIRDHLIYDNVVVLGFTERAHVPELTDRPIQGLVYMAREHGGQWQYLSVCHAHDKPRFLEAVVEVYHAPRNPKARRSGKLSDQQRKGATPLYVNIARDWAALEEMVSTTYALADDRA